MNEISSKDFFSFSEEISFPVQALSPMPGRAVPTITPAQLLAGKDGWKRKGFDEEVKSLVTAWWLTSSSEFQEIETFLSDFTNRFNLLGPGVIDLATAAKTVPKGAAVVQVSKPV